MTLPCRGGPTGRRAGPGTRPAGTSDAAGGSRPWSCTWRSSSPWRLASPSCSAPTSRRRRGRGPLLALVAWPAGTRRSAPGRCTAGRPRSALVYLAVLIAAVPGRVAQYEAARVPAVRALSPSCWTCSTGSAWSWRARTPRSRSASALGRVRRAPRLVAGACWPSRGSRSGSRCCSASGSTASSGRASTGATVIDELERTRAGAGRGQPPGRRAGRAGAAGPGDPRHPRPGLHQVVVLLELAESEVDTDPAAARQRLAIARGDRPAEPGRGPGAGRRADARSTCRRRRCRRRSAGWSTGSARRPALPAGVDRRPARHRRCPASDGGGAAARGPGGAGQRPQARRRRPGRGHRSSGAVLTVADDGAGFDPAAPTGGYGLAGMRRAGGGDRRHRVDRERAGAGTTVTVRC